MPPSLRRGDGGGSTLLSFVGGGILVVAILGGYFGYLVSKFGPQPLPGQSGGSGQVGSAGTFSTTYQTFAVSGTNVTDPFWGWTATVSVAGTIVTVTNSPVPGQLVRPYGAWDAQVVSIDDAANGGHGAILVHHLLTPAMVDRVGQKNSGGTVVFVVTAVDPVAGTYTVNYNTPTKGRTLVFQVTMLSITPTT